MGMYTEIFFRSDLRRDVPEQVINTLMFMVGDIDEETALSSHPWPEHEFFQKTRWKMIGRGGSEYFPLTESRLTYDRVLNKWRVMILSNHKNYSNETDAFFDWISPYCSESEDKFLGYELYEENDEPNIYVQTNGWRPLDMEQVQFWIDKYSKDETPL